MRLRAFSTAALLALVALAAAGPAAERARAASPGPGCASSRQAIAHYAGGAAVSPQPTGAPIPCGMDTGYAGGESAIAVTNSGAVMYAPAVQATGGAEAQHFLGGNSGFARTTDLGAGWSFLDPISTNIAVPTDFAGRPGFPAWDQIDDKFFSDRGTGRLFWTDPAPQGEVVLWTDNDGLSWGYSQLPVGFGGEWTQITTAKARSSSTNGYPKVVYACGEYDSVGRDVSTAFEGDLCQKSLDGGQTWIVAGQSLFGGPVGTHPQCGGQTEHPNFSPWAAPDSQGRLSELLFCGGQTFLIRSDDEGASWQVTAKVPYDIPAVGPGGTGSAELRTDAADNLYLAWSVPGNPNPNGSYAPGVVDLAVSRDHGATWTPPMDVLAPGVAGIRTHFGFDVGAPGRVAISYLGHDNRRAGFDGYITETSDALARRPLFWSAIANDPSQAPLDSGGKGSSNGLGLDYVSVAIGPDGTPWASFWDACGEDLPQRDPTCPASRNPAATTLGFRDFAGRLAPASPAPPAGASCVDTRKWTFKLHHSRRARIVKVELFLDGRRTLVDHGRNIATVTLRRLPRKLFHLTIVSTQSNGAQLISTRTYRGCRKSRPSTRARHHRNTPPPRGR